jgi:ATP-dependent Clp protease protease subunit
MNIPQDCPLVYVSFSTEISTDTVENLLAVMASLCELKVKRVVLLLSTPGGSVPCGFNLYNVLKGMPFELTTHNVGNVDSIGNIVFQAGVKRYACPNTTFVFHGVGFSSSKDQLQVKDVEEKLDGLLSDQKRIESIIAERTKVLKGEVEQFFKQGHNMDANYALVKGIIDEIKEVSIAPDSPIVTMVFKPAQLGSSSLQGNSNG